ncbi:MAG: HAD hydrolase family protein [bacterium]|nr:HAD hydrolase family protein [bacterium]
MSVHPSDLRDLTELQRVVQDGLRDADVEVSRSSAAVDVTPRGENKGWAITNVLSAHGLTWRETMVMGDRLNDLPALELAGLAVCPRECDAEVEAACHIQIQLPSTSAAYAALRLLDGELPVGGGL